MANWTSIDELRQIFIKKYTESMLSTELEKACSEEYELMMGYNGRQILELLQNVDDACSENNNRESVVHIKFQDNILEVGNTGTKFNSETIERLCLGRSSNKSSSNIGNKGTGFRSLLNDAEWIEIHSGEYSIRFSEKYTNQLFKKYIDSSSNEKNDLIINQLNSWKKDYKLCFPIMNCPESIEKIKSEFDTLIRVKIKDDNDKKNTSIENQLSQPFYKSILFLPNITKIVIDTSDGKRIYEKNTKNNIDYYDVTIKENESSENYYVFKKNVTINNGKCAELIIAYPLNELYDFSKEKVYCYFPIRIFQTPIHALIHAPFLTNSSRDDILNDSEQCNCLIFKEVLTFVKEVAEKLKMLRCADPIKFVTPVGSFNKLWDSQAFGLRNEYKNMLCDAKIISTVNDSYISINDHPKLLKNDYPNEFKGEGFEKLVKKYDICVFNFIEEMCKDKNISYYFNEKDLVSAIESHRDYLSIESAVNIVLWWSKYYKKSDYFPEILKDNNNYWIGKNKKVFLPTNDDKSFLDKTLSWVNLCILRQEYAKEFIVNIKNNDKDNWERIEEKYNAERTNDKRLLDAYSDSFLAISFTEQSSSRVIVAEIANQINKPEEAKQFINWFFNNYKDKITEDSELSKLRFKLLDREGDLQDSKKLYFGREYGNDLSDKLFENSDYYAICSIEKLYDGDEKEAFVEFMKTCGVLEYPLCEKISINSLELEEQKEFKSFVKSKYNYNFNINYLETYSIKNFKSLLSKLSTKEVVKLICEDYSLSNIMLSNLKYSTAQQQINWSKSYFNSNEYILYVLNNSEWIEIDGKKYSPKSILKYGKLKNKIDNLYGIQEKELISILNEDIVRKYNLDFKNDFSDFTDIEIYNILKKVPVFDRTGEISRRIYTSIIKNKANSSPNYETSDLLLYAQDGEFHLNKELVYMDKNCPTILPNSKKIDIPISQSTETIEKWFGVKKFITNLEMDSCKPINENDFPDFFVEMKDIKVCVLSILDDTDNYINKTKRVKIIPCVEIVVKNTDTGEFFSINNYSFIKKDGKYYIKIPSKNLDDLRSNHDYAMSIIEIFKEAVSPQIPSDLAELLISKNQLEKEYKIKEKYGIDMWSNSYNNLFEASFISKKICEFFRDNGLTPDLVNNLEKIDFSSDLSDDEFKLLFECLMSIKKDIKDLNDLNETINIDASSYIRRYCIEYLNSMRAIYKNKCFYYLRNNLCEQKNFLSMLNGFNSYDFSDANICNSVNYNPKEILETKYPLLKNVEEDNIDIDKIYNEHYDTCVNTVEINKEEFDYYIENNIQEKSLLYFDDYKNVIDKVKKLKSTVENKQTNNSDKDNYETTTINTELIPTSKTNADRHFKGEMSKKETEEVTNNREKSGKTAEEIAYKELKKEYNDLIWISKYSNNQADKNNLPPNGIVCDMWRYSADGNLYFEIKSAIDEFEMSINEYESMKSNQNNYYVVLVNRETKEISLHKFDEIDPLKEASKYCFKFKQVKK